MKVLIASELYKQIKSVPESDLFIIWDLSTSRNLTNAELDRLNYLIKVKYDFIINLNSNHILPFFEKYLILKFGLK